MNYRELFLWGRSQLGESLIEEAELDARLLLEAVCHTDRHDLLAHGDRNVSEVCRVNYRDYIEKRKSHIPLQYILGCQEFMGLSFLVNPHVLIPRQDTEILVEEVLRYLQDGQALLDVGTGSGCILLSLLKYSNHCRGTGTDISGDALKTAAENAVRLGVEAEWLESDLFEAVRGKYDIIVSNPPYIPTSVIGTLMQEVKDNEPVPALDGKEDGLFFYREIIGKAGGYLDKGGMIFLEIGFDQATAVTDMMDRAGFREVMVVKDLAGFYRVVSGVYGGPGYV